MSRYLVLSMPSIREKAHQWIDDAPDWTRVVFKEPKRTLPQSDKMWAMLTEVREQVRHHGQMLSTNDWKLIFLDGLKREMRLVPNLENTGFVALNNSSSDLSVSEMSDLIELIYAWGAQHGVSFKERDAATKHPTFAEAETYE